MDFFIKILVFFLDRRLILKSPMSYRDILYELMVPPAISFLSPIEIISYIKLKGTFFLQIIGALGFFKDPRGTRCIMPTRCDGWVDGRRNEQEYLFYFSWIFLVNYLICILALLLVP